MPPRLRRRARVGVDRRAAPNVLDEVRLEEHRAAAYVGFTIVQAVEQEALEVAVALRPEHRHGRLPWLGNSSGPTAAAVEYPEPVGRDRPPAPSQAAASPARTITCGGVMLSARPQRLEERVRPRRQCAPGQGERTAGDADVRVNSLGTPRAGRRAPRRGGAGRARSARASPRARDATRRRGSAAPAPALLAGALKGDQRNRGGLRVAPQVDVVDGRVAEVPAAVRPHWRSASRPSASARVARSDGVRAFTARRTRAVGSTSERVSDVQPQATRRSGSSALGSRALALRSRCEGPPRSRRVENKGGERAPRRQPPARRARRSRRRDAAADEPVARAIVTKREGSHRGRLDLRLPRPH